VSEREGKKERNKESSQFLGEGGGVKELAYLSNLARSAFHLMRWEQHEIWLQQLASNRDDLIWRLIIGSWLTGGGEVLIALRLLQRWAPVLLKR
jgi:hypothetical protein